MHGLIKFTPAEFCVNWLSTKKDGEDEGIALLLESTPALTVSSEQRVRTMKSDIER